MAETLSGEQKGLITDFKDKARKFWAMWENLNSRRVEVSSYPPEVQREYKSIMERGVGVRSKIEWITGLIDQAASAYKSVKSWVAEKFGLGEIPVRQLEGMGIIPLIPVAIISGSLATIGYWVNDAYRLNKKLDEIKRLEGKGYSPERAARVASRNVSMPGFFSGIDKLVLPLLLGGATLYYLNKRK